MLFKYSQDLWLFLTLHLKHLIHASERTETEMTVLMKFLTGSLGGTRVIGDEVPHATDSPRPVQRVWGRMGERTWGKLDLNGSRRR